MESTTREALRVATRHLYDLQKLRQQHANRISRKAEGAEAVISPELREQWAVQTKRLEKLEAESLKELEEILAKVPFYTQVLSADDPRWDGLGPKMAAVILSEVDITRANTVSALWRYAGLAPVAAWRCKSCHRLATRVDGGWEHAPKKKNEKKCEFEADTLREGQVYDSGERERPKKKEKRHYNLFLKTKLLGVLGGSFLRVNRGEGNSVWRPVYDGYKQRMISSGRGTSDGHRANASNRYMIKMFLIDLYNEWRTFEGLPIRKPYHEEKLGHVHSKKPETTE